MAYQKHKTRVLAGSLNLWPPPDKVADPDSPVLQNWRVDSAGVLRSRKGLTVDGTGLGAAVHSLHRSGNDRFGGVGTGLRTGPDLSSALATGFDGNALHFVSYQGQTWTMNQGKQGKVAPGFLFRNWIPAAPTLAATVAPGGEASIEIAEFEAAEEWTAWRFSDGAATNISGQLNYEEVNKQSGTHSLYVPCSTAAKYQVRRDNIEVPKTAIVGGESRDDDQLRIWIYCADPSAVESIYVALGCAGSPKGYVQAQVSPLVLSRDPYAWTEVKISRSLDPQAVLTANPRYRDLLESINTARTNEDAVLEQSLVQQRESLASELIAQQPYFVDSMVGGVAFDWSQIIDMVIEWTTTAACDVTLDRLRAVGGPAASLEGEYAYYVTFANDYGHESNPGPLSNYASVNKRAIALTAIPVSTDPQVTIKHVYRVGGPIETPVRVATLLNAVTTWTDEVSNDYAQDENTRLEVDADPPPAALGLLGPYLGHLIAWSTVANPARLFWTPVAQPWKWPGSDDSSEGNWIDVGQDEDPILYVTDHGNALWIYKSKSVWRLSGSPDESDPTKTMANAGAVGPRAVIHAGSKDYYVAGRGIFQFNGDFERKVSWKVEPLFHGDYAEVGGSYVPPIDEDHMDACVLGYAHGKLYFSYPEAGQSSPTMTLVYDEELDRWASFKPATTVTSAGFTVLYHEGEGRGFMGGTANGKLLLFDQLPSDGGAAIECVWQSAMLDFGLPDNPKVCSDVVIDFQSAVGAESPETITVKIIDEDGTATTLGTISSGTRISIPFRLASGEGLVTKRLAVRLECSATSTLLIYGVYVHWYPEQRTGQTFDSGVIPLADDVAQVDRIEWEITSDSPAAWRLYSDLPSKALALAASGNVDGAATRSVLRAAFSEVEGRRFRLVTATAGTMQLHRCRVRVRSLGEWFDGAANEFYSSGRLNFGSRVNEMKEVELDYDLPSGGTLAVWSEQPGAGLALAYSVAIPATTGRNRTTFIVNAAGSIDGSAFEVRVSSSGIGRIWGGVARIREIGTWIAPGEIWRSQVWAPSGPLATYHGEFEIDYDTTAAAELGLSTELPFGYMSEAHTAALALTSGRRTRRIRLSGRVKGFLAEVRITAGAAGIKLYGLKEHIRALGGAYPWQWANTPNVRPTANEWSDVRLPMAGGSKLPDGADDQWRWITLQGDAIE